MYTWENIYSYDKEFRMHLSSTRHEVGQSYSSKHGLCVLKTELTTQVTVEEVAMVGKVMGKVTRIARTKLRVNHVTIIIRVNVHLEQVAILSTIVHMNHVGNLGMVYFIAEDKLWTERTATVVGKTADQDPTPFKPKTIKFILNYLISYLILL